MPRDDALGRRTIEDDTERDDDEEIDEDIEDGDPEPEDGEDIMGENMLRDYLPNPELDRYSNSGLDEESVSELSFGARAAADAEIDARQRVRKREADEGKRTRRRHLASHLLDSDDGGASESSQSDHHSSSSRRLMRANEVVARSRRQQQHASGEDSDSGVSASVLASDIHMDPTIGIDDDDIEHPMGPLSEWVVKERVRAGIRGRFYKFLASKQDNQGNFFYKNKITNMVNRGSHSLEVSFGHLSEVYDAILAIWVSDAPAEMLEIFDDVATELTLAEFADMYKVTQSNRVHVRITDLPICDAIRDIRQIQLNALIKVAGVVTRRSVVYPQLQNIVFDCLVCGFAIGPIAQRGDKVKREWREECGEKNVERRM